MIERFCSPYITYGNDVSIPFVVDKYLYATDGKIIVRIPKRVGDEPRDRFPDPLKLGWDHDSDFHVWVDPPLSLKEIQDILQQITPECTECDEWTKDGLKCPYCFGTGKDLDNEKYNKIQWQGRKVNLKYLYLIDWQLKNVKFSTFNDDSGKYPIRFKFRNGGQGLLMPMRK